ncbi:MAG TPA: D-alanine--D-alanine ligase [Candidatus Krumholzibacteria bacterium]|nr:D-alanine--D-alanine ligase [Candidatus Krumholzibacteria bacterium]HRX51081.1 D-alanine--D-alanine ligase [Candidatus Krumholzibacteria bacterium]
MHVTLLHNEVAPDAAADEADVLVQVDAVRAALAGSGHQVTTVPCGLDLAALASRLEASRPDAVFNLVESLGGQGRLIAVVPYLLEARGLRFTGCPADAIHLTSHKTLAKRLLLQAGLPTPAWIEADGTSAGGSGGERWIVKSVWEDASLGMDDTAVTGEGVAAAARLLEARRNAPGAPWFAEAFVEGREFNIALLEGPAGPAVLPPAEILFPDYPEGKPRIVGYAAKWDPDSFEYTHTVRSFPTEDRDGPLLAEVGRLARACWDLYGLRGWARVDFRVDARGRPFILEVNANPCLAPDAGFAAALDRAGTSFADAVAHILAAAR